MLVTICTIRQLPQALALGDSFSSYTINSPNKPLVLIGLVDDPSHLPNDFVSPYPIIPIQEVLPPVLLESLSNKYTPTEFAAACKPLFIAEVFRRFPTEDNLIFADPNIQFLHSLAPIQEQIATKNAILTPFITGNPGDMHWPDEKFFQNIGLYSADFLVFHRSDETERLLAWWDNRVRERAQIDFCEGLCLDQLWLMHVPVYFQDVVVVRNPGWHIALWNLPERIIREKGKEWLISGPGGNDQPFLFINFKGLANPDEGFFPHQNRVLLTQHPKIVTLLAAYRKTLADYKLLPVLSVRPAYGKQTEPVVLRGWRYAVRQSMQGVIRFLDRIHIPVVD